MWENPTTLFPTAGAHLQAAPSPRVTESRDAKVCTIRRETNGFNSEGTFFLSTQTSLYGSGGSWVTPLSNSNMTMCDT